MSNVRQNYHEECEAMINMQINLELYASYVYMAMSYHFDRDDVDLQGFSKFFKKSSDEEREHAQLFLKLQNQRGGRIKLSDIKAPAAGEWDSGLDAMEDALALEKKVNQALLDLHVCASSHNDAQLTDFIEGHFLTHQDD
eukprot:UN24573